MKVSALALAVAVAALCQGAAQATHEGGASSRSEDPERVKSGGASDVAVTMQLPRWVLEGEPTSNPGLREPAHLVLNKSNLHGQEQEDKYAYETYFYGKTGGVFLELGALTGVRFSNTLMFERELGWRGVLIEPIPSNYERLVANRPRAICVNAAICNATTPLHLVGELGTAGIYEFMPEQQRARWHKEVQDLERLPTVACVSLGALLRHFGVRHIDFMSLDVEGAELDVLHTLDFSHTSIDVLVVEALGHDPQREDALRSLLAQHGFALDRHIGRNDWFVRQGFRPSSAPGSGSGGSGSGGSGSGGSSESGHTGVVGSGSAGHGSGSGSSSSEAAVAAAFVAHDTRSHGSVASSTQQRDAGAAASASAARRSHI